MENDNLKPIYVKTKFKIIKANIENGNIYNSEIAGFNWRNIDYPYLHTHCHWEFLIVVNGKIKHTINKVMHTATKGYACLIRPDDEHKIQFLDKKHSETLTFVFSNEVAENYIKLYSKLFNLDFSQQTLEFNLKTDTLEAIRSKTLAAQFQPKHIYEQYCMLIINRIFSAYVEKKINTIEANPDWLNDFLLFLKNPDNLKLSIPELSSHAPYSYSRLSNLFKKYMGTTLVDYLKELKFMRAKELLKNTDKPVSEIAMDLNYESVSSLNHNFKSKTGLAPLQFRKKENNY